MDPKNIDFLIFSISILVIIITGLTFIYHLAKTDKDEIDFKNKIQKEISDFIKKDLK
jgi:hypothetical protein